MFQYIFLSGSLVMITCGHNIAKGQEQASIKGSCFHKPKQLELPRLFYFWRIMSAHIAQQLNLKLKVHKKDPAVLNMKGTTSSYNLVSRGTLQFWMDSRPTEILAVNLHHMAQQTELSESWSFQRHQSTIAGARDSSHGYLLKNNRP